MLKPIKIGSLCVCDSDEPYGLVAYETWQDRGIWRLHTDYEPKVPRAKKLLIKCNIPIVVLDILTHHQLDKNTQSYLYVNGYGWRDRWVVALYEEAPVMLPASYFEKNLSPSLPTYYKEIDADISTIS
jgi:hypothetical protein